MKLISAVHTGPHIERLGAQAHSSSATLYFYHVHSDRQHLPADCEREVATCRGRLPAPADVAASTQGMPRPQRLTQVAAGSLNWWSKVVSPLMGVVSRSAFLRRFRARQSTPMRGARGSLRGVAWKSAFLRRIRPRHSTPTTGAPRPKNAKLRPPQMRTSHGGELRAQIFRLSWWPTGGGGGGTRSLSWGPSKALGRLAV